MKQSTHNKKAQVLNVSPVKHKTLNIRYFVSPVKQLKNYVITFENNMCSKFFLDKLAKLCVYSFFHYSCFLYVCDNARKNMFETGVHQKVYFGH